MALQETCNLCANDEQGGESASYRKGQPLFGIAYEKGAGILRMIHDISGKILKYRDDRPSRTRVEKVPDQPHSVRLDDGVESNLGL